MYELNDTIIAVSSPSSSQSVIIRITGPDTINQCQKIFSPAFENNKPGIYNGSVTIDNHLQLEAVLYLFLSPHSYTGQDLAEIHMFTNTSATNTMIRNMLSKGLRTANPGEFTARAYLNGKIDLAQAEAVNEIIASSNQFQLNAAQRLLAGHLAKTTSKIREKLLNYLSLLEASLDFSTEDIEFITRLQAVDTLNEIKKQLQNLLSDNISYETVIDLPSVGIAGAPNAGKSTLLNKLLGRQRSIVSKHQKTTRDVLSGQLTLSHCQCVLFDCAGLTLNTENILDELAQQAAIEALNNSLITIFCVDIAKQNFQKDLKIKELINKKNIIAVATKTDLLNAKQLDTTLKQLNKTFGSDFLPISVHTDSNIGSLCKIIDERLIKLTTIAKGSTFAEIPDSGHSIALTNRHKQAVTDAIENITDATAELTNQNEEVTAMLVRSAYQNLSDIEHEHIDDKILENIFTHFCIGK